MTSPRLAITDLRVVVALATLCCLLWGSAFPSVKAGYALLGIAPSDIGAQLLFAGYRFTLAGLVLLAYSALSGKSLRLDLRQAAQVTALGASQTALQYVFFYVGLAHATGVKASIMNSTSTFFSVLLAHFLYSNDKLTLRKTLGCLLGFAGVVAVNFAGRGFDLQFTLLGEGFVVISAFVLSLAMIYGKRISQKLDPFVMTGWQLSIGGILLCAVGVGLGGQLHSFSLEAGVLLAYMVLLSAVAFALWSLLLKHNPVGLVSVFNFLIPVFGVVLSAIFLGESMFEWKNLVALILVCGGIWMVSTAPKGA